MEAGEDNAAGSGQSWWQRAVGIAVLLGLAALVVVWVVEAFPHHVRNGKNPNFLDNIFANPVVLATVRITLLAAAVYVVVSVFALMGGRRWLSEFGPVKTTEPIANLDQSAQALESDLAEALETVEDLEQRLAESDAALADARTDIANLLDHVDTMEAKKGSG